jgi:predicted NACHT family NTPase
MILSLCAWDFLQQFEKQKTIELDGLIQIFRQHWRDESWHEVLRLMAGMLDARFTSDILEYLIGEDGKAEQFSNLFLAAECVSEVKKRNEIAAVAGKVRDRVKELTKYGNINSRTSQEYGNLVYEIHRKAVAAVAVTWKDDSKTLPWLKERARSEYSLLVREAAVQELGRGWKDDPETLSILRDRGQNDRDQKLRDFAQQKLAELESQ